MTPRKTPETEPPRDIDLRQIDLNLLVAFDVLIRTGGVTSAARALGVTQPAMSHTLNRLRELLADPLLVRGAGGWVLTPRAQQLAAPIAGSLQHLRQALGTRDFDPATTTRTFRLATPDLFDMVALPGLSRRLTAAAPGARLAITPLHPKIASALESGDLDLAIVPVLRGPNPRPLVPGLSDALRRTVLFDDEFACFVREGHPALDALSKRGRIKKKKYLAADHLLVSPTGRGDGIVDPILAALGHTRRIALRVPNFATCLPIVAATDLVLTAPAALAQVPFQGVVQIPQPFDLPTHAITMVWHPRFQEASSHRFLRQTVR